METTEVYTQRSLSDMHAMSKLVSLFEGYIEKKLYGEVIIKFNAGKVVQVRRTESIEL